MGHLHEGRARVDRGVMAKSVYLASVACGAVPDFEHTFLSPPRPLRLQSSSCLNSASRSPVAAQESHLYVTRARSSISPALTQNSTSSGLFSHFLQSLLGSTSSLPSSRWQDTHQGTLTMCLRLQGPVASGATFFSFFGAPALKLATAVAM